jgi:uncharacterized membrane protein YbjE (DUF340 family)
MLFILAFCKEYSRMYEVFISVFPIFFSLIAGYIAGKALPSGPKERLIQCIGPLVWLLLFSVGGEFGGVLGESSVAVNTLITAMVFATLTTLLPCLPITYLYGRRQFPDASAGKGEATPLWRTIKECLMALSMVVFGVFLSQTSAAAMIGDYWSSATTVLLTLLIFLVGIDLSCMEVKRSLWSGKALVIPLIVVLGSLAGGAIAAQIFDEELPVALALASGFGWFSLSGALVGSFLGPTYGATALMIDLFRELMAIFLLYIAGRTLPFTGIAASGAAAMDSTLPLIRQTCLPADVPIALVSGFLLTVAAPILIAAFLSH